MPYFQTFIEMCEDRLYFQTSSSLFVTLSQNHPLKKSTIIFNGWFKKEVSTKIETAILKKDAKTRRKEKKIFKELLYATRKSKKPLNLIQY